MKITAALLALTILASCGADGAPVTPTVSGKSTVGVNSGQAVRLSTAGLGHGGS